MWLADGAPPAPPYSLGNDAVFVSYNAEAELSCHLALRWPFPRKIIDLYGEFRWLLSGRARPHQHYGLVDALRFFRLDSITALEKSYWQELAKRGGPFTADERTGLLDYNQEDVDALARLLPAMLPHLPDLNRVLFRGRYMAALTHVKWYSLPIDVATARRIQKHRLAIRDRLVRHVDQDYGVFRAVGSVQVDPGTRFGEAIGEFAKEYNIDPSQLAEVAVNLWRERRDSTRELREAWEMARKETGLTHARLNAHEDAGGDHASWPGLDVQARELAGRYPALGIGPGYSTDYGEDRIDYAGALWEILRERDETVPPRYSPEILRPAADLCQAMPCGAEDTRPRVFSEARFANWIERKGYAWPKTDTGKYSRDADTYKEMAEIHPEIEPLRRLVKTYNLFRDFRIVIGSDERNRCSLWPFQSKTGRNQPSNAEFVFGMPAWLRHLFKPPVGRACAYLDWKAQEYGIAAALSGDAAMMTDYATGDPYLALAVRLSRVPPGATKDTHPKERKLFKAACGLGAMYGSSEYGLARRLGISVEQARDILHSHKRTYGTFWRWTNTVVMQGRLRRYMDSRLGWRMHLAGDVNVRSLQNFTMQATGADLLRLAVCLLVEAGVQVDAMIHDALVVESPVEEIDAVAARAQEIMCEAGRQLLNGFALQTDALIIRYPDRFDAVDEDDAEMWAMTMRMLTEELERVDWAENELFGSD
jgi:hypothetical protein